MPRPGFRDSYRHEDAPPCSPNGVIRGSAENIKHDFKANAQGVLCASVACAGIATGGVALVALGLIGLGVNVISRPKK